MIKESDIPPIKGNKRIGRETATDASVMWGGAKLPGPDQKPKQRARSKKPVRRQKQQNFVIKNGETLRLLSEKLGINASAVVNLGLALLAKEYL